MYTEQMLINKGPLEISINRTVFQLDMICIISIYQENIRTEVTIHEVKKQLYINKRL